MKELVRHDVLGLRVGELVEVLGEDEILATLDERGELDGLPFMPEMLQFCGRRFRVAKQAFKLCDTIHGGGMHRMEHAVHLQDVRCDGQGHGGCQAACLVYWKEAWLKRPRRRGRGQRERRRPAAARQPQLEPAVLTQATRKAPDTETGEEVYACQATELLAAPERIPPWDIKQYVQDVRSTNAGLTVLRTVVVGAFNEYQDLSVKLLPRWLRIHGGSATRSSMGRCAGPHRDPRPAAGRARADQEQGEIVKTLDAGNRNGA